MKPSGDICPDCATAFDEHRHTECMSTNLCRRCCVESDEACVDDCAAALAEISDADRIEALHNPYEDVA